MTRYHSLTNYLLDRFVFVFVAQDPEVPPTFVAWFRVIKKFVCNKYLVSNGLIVHDTNEVRELLRKQKYWLSYYKIIVYVFSRTKCITTSISNLVCDDIQII